MCRVKAPERVGRYEIRGFIGSDEHSVLYSAWDPKLHREVALKLLSADSRDDPKRLERFQREVRAVASLRHPSIVEIFDFSDPESDDLFLVTERLDGTNIEKIAEEKGFFPEAIAAALGHEVCLALDVAHHSGIVHRDIRPVSIFISDSGRVVLADFGVVKAVTSNSVLEGWGRQTEVVGTPGFMAPEVLLHEDLSSPTDIFSLGATLYKIATGEMPYQGDGDASIFRSMMDDHFSEPDHLEMALSRSFVDVLRKCVHSDPAQRFQSSAELRDRLKIILKENGVRDLREDLKDFIRDSDDYRQHLPKRILEYWLEELKIAIKDRDDERAAQARVRIAALKGPVRDTDKFTMPTPSLSLGRQWGDLRGWWRKALALGLPVGLLIGLGSVLLFSSSAEQDPAAITKTPVAETPAKVVPPASQKQTQDASVTIVVMGRGGRLTVDGKRIQLKNNQATVKLSAGKHIFVLTKRKNKLSRTLEVTAEQKYRITFNLKKKKIRSEQLTQ